MTRQITNDEYLALALRYNEQRTINDYLQKEIAELKARNEIWGRYVKECMLDIDRLEKEIDKFIFDDDGNRIYKEETADEWNNRNRIS